MKANLFRAALVACLPFCAMGALVVTAPAAAADQGSTQKNSVSKSIAKEISDAQKAITAKDWQTVIAKCKEAGAKSDLTDFDKYIINRFLGIAYLNMGDHASATTAVVAAVESPAAPPDERKQLLRPALGLENEQSNYAKVISLGKMAEQDNAVDSDVFGEMAVAYFNMKDFANAIVYAQKSIDMGKTENKVPPYAVYQVWAYSEDQTKDRANEIKAFEAAVGAYGKNDDWGHLIDFSMEALSKSSGKGFRDIAALDIYRLRLTVGAMTNEADYLAMADVADLVKSWGDAEAVLRAGLAKGVLSQAKVGPMLNKASAQAKGDEPILPQAESTAVKRGSADEEMSVAEAYYGYGRYADAARVAKLAMAKGGAKKDEAQLLLGMCQAMQGDNATAAQTFAGIDGDSGIARAAELWKLYAARPPAPAAGQ